MNNTPLSPEARRKRIETIVKVLGLGVAAFFVAPFVFIAIKGLIGLAIAAIIGWAIIFFTPVVGAMLANARLKALKAEASRNPVETLQNDYMARQSKLSEFKKSIENFIGEIGTFSDKLNDFARNPLIKNDPAQIEKFKIQLQKMNQLLALRENKFKIAQQSLVAYDMEIKKAGAIWDMAQAAAQMNNAAGMTDEDFLAKIQVETALDSVQKSLNTSFAACEVALLEEDKGNALPTVTVDTNDPAQLTNEPIDSGIPTVDVDSNPQPVRVSRNKSTSYK